MENNAIQIFNYKEQQVRTVEQNSEVWFVAKDVCDILKIVNSRDAISRLDSDEKGVAKTDTLGGMQDMTIISEPGLYKLAFKSKKSEAKDFTRWVTHEVLPAIRKHGAYIANANIEALISQNKALQEINAKLMKHIEENRSFTMLGQAITPITMTHIMTTIATMKTLTKEGWTISGIIFWINALTLKKCSSHYGTITMVQYSDLKKMSQNLMLG